MPPIVGFNHSNLYLNVNLTISNPFNVGHATSITISLSNTGTETGNAIVHLWWIGPTLSAAAGPMLDLVAANKLAPPYGSGQPILVPVQPGVGGKVTVAWTPSAADFPRTTLGPSVPGCLFAQAEVLPNQPAYPGDSSALNIWSPAYTLCAQHSIHIGT